MKCFYSRVVQTQYRENAGVTTIASHIDALLLLALILLIDVRFVEIFLFLQEKAL